MTETGIVCDGHERWRKAAETAIRAEVAADYAERLRSAVPEGAVRLRSEIETEARRRLKTIEPSREALF